jgi:hypothetical protein
MAILLLPLPCLQSAPLARRANLAHQRSQLERAAFGAKFYIKANNFLAIIEKLVLPLLQRRKIALIAPQERRFSAGTARRPRGRKGDIR